jgi:hypothetical protein
MTRVPRIYLGLALLSAVHPSNCGNECDFFERCQGGVRQTCGEGVDQCVNRRIKEEACVAPNGACVSVGGSATCARTPLTECNRSFVARCEGPLLLECSVSPEGFVVAQDCSVAGRTCGQDSSGRAACIGAP